MEQRTFGKDIFDFDCPITFCFNLRRSFSHFLLIGLLFLFFLFGKVCCFFTLFFCALWVLFLIQFVFYPFFLDLTASLLPGAATAVCEDVVLCALCSVQVLCASAVCCVLCAVCYSPCGELCKGALCCVLCRVMPSIVWMCGLVLCLVAAGASSTPPYARRKSKHIRVICYCWGNSSMVEGRFSKWF